MDARMLFQVLMVGIRCQYTSTIALQGQTGMALAIENIFDGEP